MNVTQIGEEVWKVRVEIHLLCSVNCDCNWTDLHDIHASSTPFCKDFIKTHIRFLQWYYVTDGQANIVSTAVFLFLHKESLNVIYIWQWFLHPKLRNTAQSVLSISEVQQLKLSLTPWCRVLLEKLTGLHLVKKFPAFHGTRRFITALTSIRLLSLSWATPIQFIYPHPTSWRSNSAAETVELIHY